MDARAVGKLVRKGIDLHGSLLDKHIVPFKGDFLLRPLLDISRVLLLLNRSRFRQPFSLLLHRNRRGRWSSRPPELPTDIVEDDAVTM